MISKNSERLREEFTDWIENTYWSGLSDAGPFDEKRQCFEDANTHRMWVAFRASRQWHPVKILDEMAIPDRVMFLAFAKFKMPNGKDYLTDPYCVWREDGKFVRWPHLQQLPTHVRLLEQPSLEDLK